MRNSLKPTGPANIVNRIGMVLDASSSMTHLASTLIKIADDLVAHLAHRSKELDQETRISIWIFSYSNEIHCVVWDKDVLRLPSIATFYKPYGQTALIDATLKAISDLTEIPTRYGDNSFLLYTLTDGEENDSLGSPEDLNARIQELPDEWTLAALVPTAMAKAAAKKAGFPAGNVEIWDATSTRGVEEVGTTIRAATDNYMTARASGTRSTRTLFSTASDAVNARTVQQAGMVPLASNKYLLIPVPPGMELSSYEIRTFTSKFCGHAYVAGHGYYELMKTETIQPNKSIAVLNKKTGHVYIGGDARGMLGLKDIAERVRPSFNAEFTVYVQSNSVNRKLIVGTKYLYLI